MISDIGKEKEEKLKTISTEELDVDIDISKLFVRCQDLESLEKEKQFFRELSESVIMVDTFFCKIQVEYVREVKQLIEEVKKIDSVFSL